MEYIDREKLIKENEFFMEDEDGFPVAVVSVDNIKAFPSVNMDFNRCPFGYVRDGHIFFTPCGARVDLDTGGENDE